MNKTIFIFILILNFVFVGCSDNKKLSSIKHTIIEDSINYIKKNNNIGLSNCYLVNSQLSPMQFELFFNSENIDFKKKLGKDYKVKLKKIEDDLNNNGINDYDDNRISFSSCSNSEYVISFSRMSEKYVMFYVSQENKEISINEILEKNYRFNSNEYYFYLFEFNDLGEIINIFENSVIFG